MNLNRIGLIVNPNAGSGKGLDVAGAAMRALAPREIWVGAGDMGAAALGDWPHAQRVFDWSPHASKARTVFLTQRFATEGVDALVVIGGDGTLADVAFALLNKGQADHPLAAAGAISPYLLGIGAGSTNVGPLMTCDGDEIERLAGARLVPRRVDGLVAGLNETALGLGFNDVVIGFTVLATVDGQVTDVDAAAKLQGRNIPREPEPVWLDQTRVTIKSARGETLVAEGKSVATVIVGLPDERFFGKAIAGGALLSGLVGDPAGCLVCDHLLVRTRLDVAALRQSEPVISRYVGLDEDSRIEVTGLRPGVVLCADGNPLALLQEHDLTWVRVQRALLQTLRIEDRC